MTPIDRALENATDTKACVVGPGAVELAAEMFDRLFPSAERAIIVEDPRTRAVAGGRVAELLRAGGRKVSEHVINSDGSPFHATYGKVEEVRDAIAASGAQPVAVGSGTINDLVKRASGELGLNYMIVATAASMDGYTAYGAAITKDGMKQTLDCKAPAGCIVDSAVAAAAPGEMTASGYADLIAKIPAGADWIIADFLGYEPLHRSAWSLVQDSLRDAVSNPAGCAAGDEREVRKLCEGLVMSGFAMQAMGSSRPASGTEHQISHYWDMEDLSLGGRPVSHGFKVGIGTLTSVAALEFLLEFDVAGIDVNSISSSWWPDFDSLKSRFPEIFPGRPSHVKRAEIEYVKKYPDQSRLREELTLMRDNWPELAARLRRQLMTYDKIKSSLEKAGAPVSPMEIGVSRDRYLETIKGVPFMRSRYFGLDLIHRIGLMPPLIERLGRLLFEVSPPA